MGLSGEWGGRGLGNRMAAVVAVEHALDMLQVLWRNEFLHYVGGISHVTIRGSGREGCPRFTSKIASTVAKPPREPSEEDIYL